MTEVVKTFALLHERALGLPFIEQTGEVSIAGTTIPVGTVEAPEPDFDPGAEENADMVLVRVDALSCNYRDKSLALFHVDQMRTNERIPYAFIGSEFSGTVVQVGDHVHSWSVGDQVIPDAQYPDPPAPGVRPGIVTNHAGSGWLRLHHTKLAAKPTAMNDIQAASFSLGTQTSMSMIRRAGITSQDRVLVTSARSNTSLFLLAALQRTGAQVWASSTSSWTTDQRPFLQGARLITTSRDRQSFLPEAARAEIMAQGGFTAVLDPFFDLHLRKVVPLMAMGGRYVTCGLKDQHPQFSDAAAADEPSTEGTFMPVLSEVMLTVMMANLSLIGNCIGLTEDLRSGIELHNDRPFPIPVDSTFRAEQGSQFLKRTYNEGDRFGKPVMQYRLAQ